MQTYDGNLDHVDWNGFYVALDSLGPNTDDEWIDAVLLHYGVPKEAGVVIHTSGRFPTFVRYFTSAELRRWVARTSERMQHYWAYRAAGVPTVHPADIPF